MNDLTAKMLRRPTPKAERELCECCGKHMAITELHHLVPLEDCAEFMRFGALTEIKIPLIWLCPNCHSYTHAVFSMLNGRMSSRRENELRSMGVPERMWDFTPRLWNDKISIMRAAIQGGENLERPDDPQRSTTSRQGR